jgi:hypothetical protein
MESNRSSSSLSSPSSSSNSTTHLPLATIGDMVALIQASSTLEHAAVVEQLINQGKTKRVRPCFLLFKRNQSYK